MPAHRKGHSRLRPASGRTARHAAAPVVAVGRSGSRRSASSLPARQWWQTVPLPTSILAFASRQTASDREQARPVDGYSDALPLILAASGRKNGGGIHPVFLVHQNPILAPAPANFNSGRSES